MRIGRLLLLTTAGLTLAGTTAQPGSAQETVTYSYDALGRLIAARSAGSVNNNQTRSICYDAAGNRVQYRSDSSGGLASCQGGGMPTPTPTPTPTPSITIANASATEGGSLAFAVTLSAAYSSSISVSYASAYGSAGSGDLTPVSGTLTFAAGQTSRTISVATRNDSVLEPTETFTVNLSAPTGGASLARAQGVGTIYDDDEEYPEPVCGQYLC